MTRSGHSGITIHRAFAFILLSTMMLCTFSAYVAAQSEDSGEQEKGIVVYEKFQGSSNTLGQVMKMDSTVGYNVNKHVGIDAGVPFYFVHSSPTPTTTGSTSSNSGVGNAYVDLRLTINNPTLNFASTLTGAAPTGDTATGFSTGRVTFDWNNYFDHTFSRITPFANVGVANSISDTHFFTRPFTSLGLVSHFEGGANLRLSHYFSVGAAAYDILPSGQQKIYSKLIKREGSGSGVSGRSHKGVFESNHVTVGDADIARDNGYSAWLDITPAPYMDLELGYNRSVPYALNTISFSVGFNLGYLARQTRGH